MQKNDTDLKRHRQILLHIVAPIFLGTTIYGLFRGLHFIDPTEKYFPIYYAKLPDWLQYNLPDGLWFYALLSALSIIWQDNSSRQFFLWLLLAIMLSYLTEIFQALHFIPGTFDWNDLLAYSIATIIYIFNFKILNKQLLTIKK
jgi:hypothetical protein